jgi:serine/threonine-protein kinase
VSAVENITWRQSDPLIGQLLDARYRVRELIGRGGMGAVYLAEHVLLQRKVAIKTLHAPLAFTSEVVARFHREAIAASSIGSEHIATVTDMGRLDGGAGYIVMEYLEGADVAHVVADQGPLGLLRAGAIALQLCKALSAVHGAGIVHRDLKPENLFLTTREGNPDFLKILDFGICKFRDPAALGGGRITATAVALGTPHFMAPEQIEGNKHLDQRADIYAVGANLYFMLTGATPFDAASIPSLFHRICWEAAPDVRVLRPDVPEALARLVERALNKRPEQRFAHVRELGAELRVALPGAADAPPSPLSCAALPQRLQHAATLPTLPSLRAPEWVDTARSLPAGQLTAAEAHAKRRSAWPVALTIGVGVTGLCSLAAYATLSAVLGSPTPAARTQPLAAATMLPAETVVLGATAAPENATEAAGKRAEHGQPERPQLARRPATNTAHGRTARGDAAPTDRGNPSITAQDQGADTHRLLDEHAAASKGEVHSGATQSEQPSARENRPNPSAGRVTLGPTGATRAPTTNAVVRVGFAAPSRGRAEEASHPEAAAAGGEQAPERADPEAAASDDPGYQPSTRGIFHVPSKQF